jgi:hypothetical protein
MENEREIIHSPKEDRQMKINGVQSPRMSPYIINIPPEIIVEEKVEIKMEEPEKIDIKIENKQEPVKEIDYDNLSKEEELEKRVQLETKRMILVKRHKNYEIFNYTHPSIPLKRAVKIHNDIVKSLKISSSTNKYKGYIVGISLIGEGLAKFVFKTDMINGFTNSQRELVDSYDQFFEEISEQNHIEDSGKKSNPKYDLMYAMGTNTLFILIVLIVGKLIGNEVMAKSITKTIFDYFKPSEIKGKYEEETLDGGENNLLHDITSINNLVDAGLILKNSFSGNNNTNNNRTKYNRPML